MMDLAPATDCEGKFFEVRYFLNVIVGSAHTSVLYALSMSQADILQEAGDSTAAHRTHTHGTSSHQQ
jgi:hypothetical protein